MKRILTLLVCALLCQALGAQQFNLESLLNKVQTNRISLDYTCTLGGKTQLKGKVLAQQNSYYASLPGMEIYCDGRTRWTVDSESKEVYIEDSDGIMELLGNADSYLAELKDLKITNVRTLEPDPDMSAFSFSTAGLANDWLVQDLR